MAPDVELMRDRQCRAHGQALLWFFWRYYRWREAGGKGGFINAAIGGRRRAVVKSKPDDFKIWPMLKFQPKYAT